MQTINLNNAIRKVSKLKEKGKIIVFTNGCFDLLHKGHLSYLEVSKKLGDYFIVGLNSDSSVKKLKGKDRPVNNEMARAKNLLSTSIVDDVIIFNEDNPRKLINGILPNVLTKGGDYNEGEIIGADIVKSSGGIVEIIPLLEGYSTTKIIRDYYEKA